MDVRRLTLLAAQLERGAPGVAFCLEAPRSTIELALGPDGDPLDAKTITQQQKEKGMPCSYLHQTILWKKEYSMTHICRSASHGLL